MKYIKNVKVNSKVSILYDDDEDDEFLVYYDGTVVEINGYGNDENGVYVNCSVVYDDDEVDDNVLLYEELYNKDELTGWLLMNEKSRCPFTQFVKNQRTKIVHGVVGSILTLGLVLIFRK